MNKLLMECVNMKSAFVPADLNGAAATGARISMAEGYGMAVILHAGDSTGAAFTVSFQQHTAATGGTSADLNVQTNYHYKADTATEFTRVEVRPDDSGLAASVDLASVFAAAEGIVVFEFLPEFLTEGYEYISVNVADTTAAKVVGGTYVVTDSKFKPACSTAL